MTRTALVVILISALALLGADPPSDHATLTEYWDAWNEIRETADWNAGIELLTRALDLFPDEIGFHAWLNFSLREEGRKLEAYEQIRAAYERFPGDEYIIGNYSASLLSLGWEYYGTDQRERGFELFETAYAINPDDEWTQNAYGVMLRDSGDLGEAISFFERAAIQFPGNRYIRENYLWSLAYMGDRFREAESFSEANGYYEAALQLQPDNESVHLSLGHSLRLGGDPAEALLHFDRVLEIAPDNPYVVGNLVNAYLDLERLEFAAGRISRAVTVIEETLSRFPGEIWLLFDLIDYRLAEGSLNQAASALVEFSNPASLRENGEPRDVRTDLVHQRLEALVTKYCEFQRFDDGARVVDEIEHLYPDAYFVLNARAKLLYFQDRREEGIAFAYAAYDSFIADHPESLQSLIVEFPMEGTFVVTAGNSSRSAITHSGLHQYAFDFSGSDTEGNIKRGNLTEPGVNDDYFGFGTAIYSPVSGIVERVIDMNPDIVPTNNQVLRDGNAITIRDDRGFHHQFAHIRQFSAKVVVGRQVRTGDLIGELGNSGFTSQPHLHYAVYSPDWLVTLPVDFREYSVIGSDGTATVVSNGNPKTGEVISHSGTGR